MIPGEIARRFSDIITDNKLEWIPIQASHSEAECNAVNETSVSAAPSSTHVSIFQKGIHVYDVHIRTSLSFAVPFLPFFLSLLEILILFVSYVTVPAVNVKADAKPLSPYAAATAASALAHSQWTSSPSSLPLPLQLPSGTIVYRLTDSFADYYASLCTWFPGERESLYRYFNSGRPVPRQAGAAIVIGMLSNVRLFIHSSSFFPSSSRLPFLNRHSRFFRPFCAGSFAFP